MCLTRVYKKTNHDIQFGYKAFVNSKFGPQFIHFLGFFIDRQFFYSAIPPVGEWICANPSDIYACDGNQYPSGFHFFKTINQAKRYASSGYLQKLIIRKIEVKDIIVYGVQHGIRCYVARQMKILEE